MIQGGTLHQNLEHLEEIGLFIHDDYIRSLESMTYKFRRLSNLDRPEAQHRSKTEYGEPMLTCIPAVQVLIMSLS